MQQDVIEMLQLVKSVSSLDVGQMRDYSVLTILETYDRVREDPFGKLPNRFKTISREYHISYQEQKKGLDYPSQIEWILQKLNSYRALPEKKVPMTLLCETNGIGLTVFQLLKKQCPQSWHIRGVLLTSGDGIKDENSVYHVPKREIINSLLFVLDSGQLKIPSDLPTKQDLLNQASGFVRSFTETGKEKLESDTESRHDDLIISLAHGCWYSLYRGEMAACPSIYGSVEQAQSYGCEPSGKYDSLLSSFKTEWQKVSGGEVRK